MRRILLLFTDQIILKYKLFLLKKYKYPYISYTVAHTCLWTGYRDTKKFILRNLAVASTN